MGAFINNKFVGMSAENMDAFKYLLFIKIGMAFLCMTCIFFIPTYAEIDKYAEEFKLKVQ